MNKTSLTVEFPFVTYADDYHDFSFHQHFLREVFKNENIFVSEACFDYDNGIYVGIAYVGSLEENAGFFDEIERQHQDIEQE